MSLQDKIKNAEETMWPLTMGVTTEKAVEQLLNIMDSMPDDACGDWRDSLAYAIDAMRKYQKIEEISKMSTCGIIEKYKRINNVINDGGEDGKID